MGHLLRDCKDKQFRGALQEATNLQLRINHHKLLVTLY